MQDVRKILLHRIVTHDEEANLGIVGWWGKASLNEKDLMRNFIAPKGSKKGLLFLVYKFSCLNYVLTLYVIQSLQHDGLILSEILGSDKFTFTKLRSC